VCGLVKVVSVISICAATANGEVTLKCNTHIDIMLFYIFYLWIELKLCEMNAF
jgi:hypothetical protein